MDYSWLQTWDEAWDELSYSEWLQTLTPTERSVETGTNPDEEFWSNWTSTDEEIARLERIAMYSSTEEYDRYEGDDA
jgi:hypothetical protein